MGTSDIGSFFKSNDLRYNADQPRPLASGEDAAANRRCWSSYNSCQWVFEIGNLWYADVVSDGSEVDTSSPLIYGTPSSRADDTPRTPGALGTPHRSRADIRSERRPTVAVSAGSELVTTHVTSFMCFFTPYLFVVCLILPQTCSQDRQWQDQDQDQSVRDQDQDRKWQYETKCTQFTQKLLLLKTSKTLIDV